MVTMAEILLGAVGTIAGVAGTIESIQNGVNIEELIRDYGKLDITI